MTTRHRAVEAGASAAQQVETTLFRALVVLRVLVTVYTLVRNGSRFDQFARPGLLLVAMGVMVGWTAFTVWAYDAPRRRRPALYLADVAVAVGLLLSTLAIESEAMLERQAPTVPTFWVITPVLACAVGGGWLGPLLAAVVVVAADLSVRTDISRSWGNIFLLLLAAGMVTFSTRMLKEAAEVREAAERAQAVQAERARLARAVHDGVLQVLALVQRRGAEAGGDLAELARLAGEQEAALRRLVQADARSLSLTGTHAGAGPPGGVADLMTALAPLGSSTVTVTGPGHPVQVNDHQAREVRAVVGACLDNVARHVGAQAPAWVLVEELGETVVVSVRDEGAGIPDGRLAEAEQEGRLGVRESICGRMADLGGSAALITGPGRGTEWELTLPTA